MGPTQAARFTHQHSGLVNQLEDVKHLVCSVYQPILSNHHDELKDRQYYLSYLPFEQHVAQAMQRLYQQHNFNPNQRKWLERLAK